LGTERADQQLTGVPRLNRGGCKVEGRTGPNKLGITDFKEKRNLVMV